MTRDAAEARLATLEVRSYEAAHVGGLWHWGYHHGSRKVLTENRLLTPHLLAIIDDYLRILCYAQWYLAETAENVVHGLMQAMQKRGLPRQGAERLSAGKSTRSSLTLYQPASVARTSGRKSAVRNSSV